MASIAPLPPTPQQLSHMPPPQASPPQQQIPPSQYGKTYNMSFDSEMSQRSQSVSQSFPNSQPGSFNNGPISGAGYSRSFGQQQKMPAPPQRHYEANSQIYTAVYSGVSVYEMEVHGVAVMRRRSDGWLNATQILKIAGVEKGRRTKVLEKEILTGEHEKVQGGYGKYQGTWISYRRGREFCRQYGVEDILRPLLDYDISADGSGGQGGQQGTPTKEQAMAANRKRFYNTGVEAQRSGPVTNGTFFSNMSPTTSVALAAMNKAARLNSPAPRSNNMRRPSQQDTYPVGSQQSMMSDGSFSTDAKHDSGYSTQPNGEPPRKRMRPDNGEGMGAPSLAMDESMRSASPTEPNESFYFENAMNQESAGDGEPVALPPLPSPTSEAQQQRVGMVLDLFAEAGRTDYASHPALAQLNAEDLNMPLDASANNALHWAATLAKVSLLKLLIQKGANIYRGNAAGQSPLISAVLVNNCWEHSCFPELLEVLGPLIEVRDLQGRTILHHIAVSSGIKGRAPSSKYYLEALLEFLIRSTQSNGPGASMQATGDGIVLSSQESVSGNLPKGTVSLVKFLSHILDARDKAGNTALNLVARIGNQSIIKQLLEIHADPTLPNYRGVSAKDFGVLGPDDGQASVANTGFQSQQSTHPNGLGGYRVMSQESHGDVDMSMSSASQTEELSQDVIASMTTMLTQSLAAHKDFLRSRTEQIDQLNVQIQEISNVQKQDHDQVQDLKEHVRLRKERQARIANLRRTIVEKRQRQSPRRNATNISSEIDPPWLNPNTSDVLTSPPQHAHGSLSPAQRQLLSKVPSPKTLNANLQAYKSHTSALEHKSEELKAHSVELEALYRKVVSLCTGVEESKVEESLPALVAAVESEKIAGDGRGMEVGRVREFLRKVDGGTGGFMEGVVEG